MSMTGLFAVGGDKANSSMSAYKLIVGLGGPLHFPTLSIGLLGSTKGTLSVCAVAWAG